MSATPQHGGNRREAIGVAPVVERNIQTLLAKRQAAEAPLGWHQHPGTLFIHQAVEDVLEDERFWRIERRDDQGDQDNNPHRVPVRTGERQRAAQAVRTDGSDSG